MCAAGAEYPCCANLLKQVREPLPQRLLGPIQPRLDGFLRALHHAGDLGVGQVVVFRQHDRGALFFRQLGNRGGDVFTGIVVLRGRRWLGRVLQRLGRVPFPVPQPVDARIARQGEQPRRKIPARPVFADVLIDAHKYLLRNIVRVTGITEQPVTEIDEGKFVARQQFIERGFLAALQALDQLRI
jgi:hypothetical protein